MEYVVLTFPTVRRKDCTKLLLLPYLSGQKERALSNGHLNNASKRV